MLIVLVGPSGVGKTVVCTRLMDFGFFPISASETANQMFQQENGFIPSKVELAKYGNLILSSSLEKVFCREILGQFPSSGSIIIDGLRSELTINHLRHELGAKVVGLTRSIPIEDEFYNGPRSNSELHELTTLVDIYLERIHNVIDLVVVNDGSVDDTCKSILNGLKYR